MSLHLLGLCWVMPCQSVPQCLFFLAFNLSLGGKKKKSPENTTQVEEVEREEGSKSFLSVVCVEPPAGADLSWYILQKSLACHGKMGKVINQQ